LVQDAAGERFKPEEYIKYFEDLDLSPDAEIGPKGLFQMAFKNTLDITLK